MATTIEEMLDNLSNFESAIDLMKMKYQDMIDALISPEVREQIRDIEAEKKTAVEAAEEGINKLRDQIRKYVLEAGETVAGQRKECRYFDGKTSVDVKKLKVLSEELSKVNPTVSKQINSCINKGEPYTAFHNRN